MFGSSSQLQLRLLRLMAINLLNFASTSAVGKDPMRAGVQVSGDWDCPELIFRFGLPQTSHPNHSILHTIVTFDHVDNNLFKPAWGEKNSTHPG